MKNTNILIAVVCCTIVAGLTISKSATAGVSIGISYSGGYIGYSDHHSNSGHGHHYKKHHHDDRHGADHYRYKPYRHKQSYGAYGRGYQRYYSGHRGHYYQPRRRKPCRQVSKYSYDENGYRHKIGGTMCFDKYGEGYVVEGSRYYIW